jgi:hypothetical protein
MIATGEIEETPKPPDRPRTCAEQTQASDPDALVAVRSVAASKREKQRKHDRDHRDHLPILKLDAKDLKRVDQEMAVGHCGCRVERVAVKRMHPMA